jgi:predicted ATPase
MIEELVLENFRGFRSLDLKGLKPVNLIAGHNNTGKTSLLEGVLLSCQVHRGNELPGMFRANQGQPNFRYFPWLIRDGVQNGTATLKSKEGAVENSLALTKMNNPAPAGFIGPAGNVGSLLLWQGANQRRELACRFVSVQHRDPISLVSLIGKAYRKRGGEETFQKLLATIDSRIKKVRIDPGEDGNQVVVDIGLSELLPLAQVGQGVYRLAAIVADIIGEQPAVLLIDEVENGLHHSVQRQVWTGLAEVARELKVQIFATTHSGECLRAAHKAFLERQTYDLGVIQLFRTEDGVQGRLLDMEHIEAAIKADIELR